jgi:hypothetical protein
MNVHCVSAYRIALVALALPSLSAISQDGSHAFTVRDAIELTHFSTPAQASSDGRHFLLVTTRGRVESNELESTLWVLEADAVRQYLRGARSANAPQPRAVAKVAAVPQAESSSSYGPVLSRAQWERDSHGIRFMGQNSDGTLQLYRADVETLARQPLTPEGQDVVQYDLSGGTLVYAVKMRESAAALPGTPINASASAVTGVRLTDILFPERRRAAFQPSELWVARSEEPPVRIAKNPGSREPLRLSNRSYMDFVAVSPDGRWAAVLLPVEKTPATWERYEPGLPHLRFRSGAGPDYLRGPFQYGLVDIDKRTAAPLFDAPHGWSVGFPGSDRPVWSADGKSVLLPNTYLPLDGATASDPRLRPCVTAILRLADRDVRCSGTLAQATEVKSTTGARSPITLEIKQDIDIPPALWASDTAGRSKMLWDPNPGLKAKLGKASVYRWKDPSGYEWIAGLVKPPGYVPGQRYPLVIQTHGFKAHEFIMDMAARPLASAGIVVLQMPDRHDDLVSLREAPNHTRGFRSAIEALNADGLIDPKRVGIIGFSRTCYYVESALIEGPELYAAATIADGVDESYLQYLMFSDPDEISEQESLYGSKPFGAGLKNWIEAAPGFRLHPVRTPLRLEAIRPGGILGRWEIYASLRLQGKPVDLIYIPDGQHVLQKPLERLASQQGNVDWFRFWLQNYEDPAAEKRAHFARWRVMRVKQCERFKGESEPWYCRQDPEQSAEVQEYRQ